MEFIKSNTFLLAIGLGVLATLLVLAIAVPLVRALRKRASRKRLRKFVSGRRQVQQNTVVIPKDWARTSSVRIVQSAKKPEPPQEVPVVAKPPEWGPSILPRALRAATLSQVANVSVQRRLEEGQPASTPGEPVISARSVERIELLGLLQNPKSKAAGSSGSHSDCPCCPCSCLDCGS